MYKKLLMALLLIINHSVMIGVTEAAHMPDEEHPFGHTVDYDHADEPVEHSSDDGHDYHEQHHKHGAHVHLGIALPVNVDVAVQPVDSVFMVTHKALLSGLIYSPPVPPPNR